MVALLLLFALETSPAAATKPPSSELDHAWSILEDGIDNKDAGKRAKAVHALGLLRESGRAERCAERALEDENLEVRVEAATALGKLGARAARPKLRHALDDKEVKMVIAATNALYQLKDPIAFDVYYTLLTGERKSSSGLLQSQLDRLRNRKDMEKLAFETGIGFVPFGGMGYEAWKTITHDDSSPVRALAAERLARDPDPKSADALIQSRFDKKWQVRAAVVNAIAERSDRSLLDPAIALMDDDNDNVRYDAAATVVHLSGLRRARKK
jgi:HEAT repeat protein